MKIVVIGNGMVGYKFCEKLTAKAQPGRDRFLSYALNDIKKPQHVLRLLFYC